MAKSVIGLLIGAVMSSSVPALAGSQMERNRAKMEAMSPADFRRAVEIRDDDMESVAVITTRAAYKSKGEGDTWLAAGIDKRTGRTIYQINGFIRYVGGWRFYSVGTYSHPGGPTSGQLMTQRRIDNCYVSCQYEENVSLVVDEFTMQQVAQEGEMWRLRFQGNGVVWDDVMNPAEVAALLEAVTSYKRARLH